MEIKVGDKIIFYENNYWKYGEEVVCEITNRGLIWFRDGTGDISNLPKNSFWSFVRRGDISIKRSIKPTQQIKPHKFIL